jgi:hypothetical protein
MVLLLQRRLVHYNWQLIMIWWFFKCLKL